MDGTGGLKVEGSAAACVGERLGGRAEAAAAGSFDDLAAGSPLEVEEYAVFSL